MVCRVHPPSAVGVQIVHCVHVVVGSVVVLVGVVSGRGVLGLLVQKLGQVGRRRRLVGVHLGRPVLSELDSESFQFGGGRDEPDVSSDLYMNHFFTNSSVDWCFGQKSLSLF